MLTEKYDFFCGKLKLEGLLHLPGESAASPEMLPGVVVCHPHPLYGGNMHNNVVAAVARALSEEGIAVLSFNFRGVGASEGSFDDGNGEQDDLKAALAALSQHPQVDSSRLAVAGYSFGGMVALLAAGGCDQMRALALVSPVVTRGLMHGLQKPVYAICGTKDHVVATEMLIEEAAKADPPGQVVLIKGVDHFWGGCEQEMAGKVTAFLAGELKPGH